MRIARALGLALIAVPVLAQAQASDALVLGERVRVRVIATHGDANLFIGTLAAISPDTLTVAIPGGRGTIILPRASISEVARSDGRESHFRNLPMMVPMLVGNILLAALPLPQGPHANASRNFRFALLGSQAFMIGHAWGRTPPEHWRPLYSWLDRP